jgi:hypothetical protein
MVKAAIEHKDASTDAQQEAIVAEFGANGKLKGLHMTTDEALPEPATKKKRNKVIDKTNCLPEMTVTTKHDVWTVGRLVLEHNHKLLAPSLAKLLRSHRYFSEQEKAMIRSFVEVNTPNKKILAFLAYLRGGMEKHKSS